MDAFAAIWDAYGDLMIASYMLSIRSLAIICAALVLVDQLGERFAHGPVNLRDPVLNSWGWIVQSAGVIGGGITFIYYEQVTVGVMDSLGARMGVLWIWTLIAAAMVLKTCARAERQWYAVAGAALFLAAGFVAVMLEGT
jgi:hypothetical protein